tara:strand:+ start:1254 stop:1919 length:666 start_codon:yes stop_codon:yes gene_type:complete
MKKWVHKVEYAIDWLIPWMILLLLIIIVIELFFHDFADTYHLYINILDYIVIGVFVGDLYFKYKRMKNIKKFLKSSWLDIIAVFPFFLIFRFVERFIILIELSKDLKQFQMLFHEGLELEKSGSKMIQESTRIIQEAEKAGKVSRVNKIIRFFRPIQRTPRLIKALPFFEQPTGKHHIHDPKKEFEEVEEAVAKEEEKVKKVIKKEENYIIKKIKKIKNFK